MASYKAMTELVESSAMPHRSISTAEQKIFISVGRPHIL